MDVVAAYRAMTAKDRRGVLLAEYRCRERCLLLHIWQAPTGRYYYQPPYRLSPEITALETAESARRKRTSDGYRRWRERAGSVDELIEFAAGGPRDVFVGLTLTCDHVREAVPAEQFVLKTAQPGRPLKILVP